MTNRKTKTTRSTLLLDLSGLCARASIRYNSATYLGDDDRDRLFGWLLAGCNASERTATKADRLAAVAGLRRILDGKAVV